MLSFGYGHFSGCVSLIIVLAAMSPRVMWLVSLIWSAVHCLRRIHRSSIDQRMKWVQILSMMLKVIQMHVKYWSCQQQFVALVKSHSDWFEAHQIPWCRCGLEYWLLYVFGSGFFLSLNMPSTSRVGCRTRPSPKKSGGVFCIYSSRCDVSRITAVEYNCPTSNSSMM